MIKLSYLALILFMYFYSCATKLQPDKHFQLNKCGALIAPPDNMPANNPAQGAYYTSLVKMDGLKNFPFDYALYFSTDHSRDKGGIWLYLCNGDITKKENWVSYEKALKDGKFDYITEKPVRNPIYIDTFQGRQTETPYVNIIDAKVYMSYHNVLGIGSQQATMMATSEDGINFNRISEENAIILPVREHLNHTGYFRWGKNKFEGVNYKYVGYSLLKGTDDYRSGMWGSNDALNWEQVEMFNSTETNLTMPESDKFLIWHGFDPNSVRKIADDEYIALTTGGTRASGNAKRVTEIYEIVLAADGRTLKRKSRKALAISNNGLDSEELDSPSIIFEGDSIKLVYVGTTDSGKRNSVMGASGIFNKRTIETPELSDEETQAHFYTQEDYEKDILKYKR